MAKEPLGYKTATISCVNLRKLRPLSRQLRTLAAPSDEPISPDQREVLEPKLRELLWEHRDSIHVLLNEALR